MELAQKYVIILKNPQFLSNQDQESSINHARGQNDQLMNTRPYRTLWTSIERFCEI